MTARYRNDLIELTADDTGLIAPEAGQSNMRLATDGKLHMIGDANEMVVATEAELAAHEADTTAVHGITDTAVLETLSGSQAKADSAQAFAIQRASHTGTQLLETISDAGSAAAADVSDFAGIGFDTLANVLVVDPSFDASTAGWGVTAFANLEDAATASASDDKILVYGAVTSAVFSVAHVLWIHFAHGSYCSPAAITVQSGGYLVLSGSGWARVASGSATPVVTVEIGGTLSLHNLSIIHTGGGNTGYVIQLDDGFSGFSSYAASVINEHSSSPNAINIVGSAGSIVIDSSSVAGAITASTAISPSITRTSIDDSIITNVLFNALDHSNVVNGETYRESVAVASLPAASSTNIGALAMTSDGGTGSAPAMMVNLDGANWTVAYE